MGEGPTGTNNADRRDRQRLTVPETATVLGVTVDAVRGRIRRGKLDSEHDKHGTVYVWIDAEEADRRGPSDASQGPSPTVEGPSGDSKLFEALEDRISSLERQLEAERAANRENRRLLAAALERIPAIEAPQEPREDPETGAEPQMGTEVPTPPREPETGVEEHSATAERPDEGTARRSWWRRFLFGG